MSQAAASSQAPPTQTPSTAAITGCGAATTSRVSRLKPVSAAAHSSGVSVAVSRRSSPEEKAPPSPWRTIARASEPPASASAPPSAASVSPSQAFSRSGRDQRIQTAAPSRATRDAHGRSSPS